MNSQQFSLPACKKFSGYKPCFSYKNCLEFGCQQDIPENKIGTKILVVSLDALGNVLDNTAFLPALKRKFPVSTVYLLTMPNAEQILFNNAYIDKVFVWTDEHRMILRNMEFDYLMNADKSVYAGAFANEVKAKNKVGFLLDVDGKIVPANSGAFYNYRMGIDDELKFRKNQRTGLDIIHETFELDYIRDEYTFALTDDEARFVQEYRTRAGLEPGKTTVGFNTGCSTLFPNKKMTIEQHVKLINVLAREKNLQLVLLGGREDTERNLTIHQSVDASARKKLLVTPTWEGIRKGACYIGICDIVISGDSFGMHLAIALKKYVIAWFGLSCWTEIELYGSGEKLIPHGLECSPCWKQVCPYNLECIDMIDLEKIADLVRKYAASGSTAVLNTA